ncbi:Frag1/DRAM/Sfk1 family-domain-containing protein [Leucosporidium creatinivorum]|uniref:Frag1/DRAM/Sfk1 family-domain-containing protein n=1 Tax=Leucosporidium creatinivorum TaxID=106004 RepID=A0A1Y2ET55_9BASI|nr:Frag1/DRAM/Sfk1 family-domain-containing protein [Leucosporidium creatinivorum]
MYIRGQYHLLPLASAIFWTATLLGLLLWWVVDDNAEQYKIDESTVIFISNVGAAHQALFIAGCALTVIFWTLTLLAERWLRHIRRIPGTLHKKETVADICSVVFGLIGGLALVLVSAFNCWAFPNIHWSFAAIFVVAIAISAVFQTLETMWLERDHLDRKHLKRNAIMKLIIITIAIAGAIGFGVCYGLSAGAANDAPPSPRDNIIQSVAASLEWFIAFLYDLYIMTYVVDLWPATKTEGHKFTPSLIEKDRLNQLHHHKDGRPGAPGGLDTPHHGFGAENETASGISYPDEIGARVGRRSEEAQMRHVV